MKDIDIATQELEALMNLSNIENLHGKKPLPGMNNDIKYKLLNIWKQRYSKEITQEAFNKIESKFIKKALDFDNVARFWFLEQKLDKMGKHSLSGINASIFGELLYDDETIKVYFSAIDKLLITSSAKNEVLENIGYLAHYFESNSVEEEVKNHVKNWYKSLPDKKSKNGFSKQEVIRSLDSSWVDDFLNSSDLSGLDQAHLESALLNILNDKNSPHSFKDDLKDMFNQISDLSKSNQFHLKQNDAFRLPLNNFYYGCDFETLKTVDEAIKESNLSNKARKHYYPDKVFISNLIQNSFPTPTLDKKTKNKLTYVLENQTNDERSLNFVANKLYHSLLLALDQNYTVKFFDSILKMPRLGDKIKSLNTHNSFDLFDYLSQNEILFNTPIKLKINAKQKSNTNYFLKSPDVPDTIKGTMKALANLDNLSSIKDTPILPIKNPNKNDFNEIEDYLSEGDVEKVKQIFKEWQAISSRSLIKKNISTENSPSLRKRKI